MQRVCFGLALLVLNLQVAAYATPVLSYVDVVRNYSGQANATFSLYPNPVGDNGFAMGTGRFDLDDFFGSGPPPNMVRMSLRSARLTVGSIDDSSDAFETVSSAVTNRVDEDFSMYRTTRDWDYYEKTVYEDVFRVERAAAESISIEAGGIRADGAPTSVLHTQAMQPKTLRSSAYVLKQPWWESVLSFVNIYCDTPTGPIVCGQKPHTEWIEHKGESYKTNTVQTVTGVREIQTGNPVARLDFDAGGNDQFLVNNAPLEFNVFFHGDQILQYATLDFNYDMTVREPRWTDVPDPGPGTGPEAVPEPGSIALLLLGLAGLGFARKPAAA